MLLRRTTSGDALYVLASIYDTQSIHGECAPWNGTGDHPRTSHIPEVESLRTSVGVGSPCTMLPVHHGMQAGTSLMYHCSAMWSTWLHEIRDPIPLMTSSGDLDP